MSDKEGLEIIGKKLGIKSSNITSGFEGGRLIKLTLVGSKELPEGIFDQLSSLKRLNLEFNQLAELPEGIFDQLSSLKRLDLSDNQLTELPEGIFDQLSSLTHLYLGDNQLTELPEGIFDQLSSLEVLDLGDNQLTELPEGIFDQLSSLTYLYLESNKISIPPGIKNKYYSGSEIPYLISQIKKWYRQKKQQEVERAQQVILDIQKILKILTQVRVGIPMTLLRLSELVTLEKSQTELILNSILDQQSDLGEYLPMEQVFIRKSEVKEEFFTQSTFTDSLQTCEACGDSQSILIRVCTNCGGGLPHCNICKRGFAEKDQITNCPECDNPFHRTHLIAQVQSSGTCPICRGSLTLSQVS